MRGKVRCLLYLDWLYGDEPVLTIGPDYSFSLTEIALLNVALGFSYFGSSISGFYEIFFINLWAL